MDGTKKTLLLLQKMEMCIGKEKVINQGIPLILYYYEKYWKIIISSVNSFIYYHSTYSSYIHRRNYIISTFTCYIYLNGEIMKYSILFLFLFIKILVFAPPLPVTQSTHITVNWIKEIQNKQMYDKTIQHLIKNEGLRLTPYYCPAGYLTIGYGHRILRNEHYTHITKEQAKQLLENDFNKRLHKVPHTLEYNKRLAITHFIFNVGEGAYNRSTLKKLVLQKLPIDKEIVKWVHYRANGKIYTSRNLFNSRQFELKLYKNV